MEIRLVITNISILLVAIWLISLLWGVAWQLRHALRDWVDDAEVTVRTNPVLDTALRALGLEHVDRLNSALFIVVALLAWPVGLVLAFSAIKVVRARDLRRKEKSRPEVNNAPTLVAHREVLTLTENQRQHCPAEA
ncbi:hypothetical protein AEQ67_13850 [Pseudomonas sp. RIT-PI-q]|uniref:hypothetical protein n=1 Tax=Pseudomonas sp. RIT-PI-q TaxID=1690247 RepID=UPI0006CC72B3|nr:hypothetical protein [Pseudomonas sp. RIT-PI-q]KPG98429.1 hypothetical protein AEQ67_13850 [Pseudomonas sp. RIT-PI-q]